MVSRTQYASLVSAIVWSCHLTWRWRPVFSSKGGRGKLWTLSLGFGGISVSGLSWVGPSRRITSVAEKMMRRLVEVGTQSPVQLEDCLDNGLRAASDL